MITNPQHTLSFGPVNMIQTAADLATQGYRIGVLGDDMSFGSPEQVRRTIESWLQDGVLTETDGYGNRELSLPLLIEANTSDHIAQAEAVLMGQVGRPNLVMWSPPDGDGATCVFEIVTSELRPVSNDMDDLRVQGAFTLMLTALPFVRAVDPVTVSVPAPSTGTPTITLIDNCSSTTNWVGVPNIVVVLGQLLEANLSTTASPGNYPMSLARTGLSQSMAASPYLRVQWSRYAPEPGITYSDPVFEVNGTAKSPVAQSNDYVWLDCTGMTINSVKVSHTVTKSTTATIAVRLSVLDLSRSTAPSNVGLTGRALFRTLPVAGVCRTPGTIGLANAASGLGTTYVHSMPTIPGLIQPSLRPFLTSGNTQTADSSTVSGNTSDLGTLHTFDLPASGLIPGCHLLVMRFKTLSVGDMTISWAVRARQNGSNLPEAVVGTTTVTMATNTWTYVILGAVELPVRELGANGLIRIELQQPNASTLDDAWVFNLDDGHLTIIEAGSNKNLWIQSPDPQDPVFRYFLGPDSDKANSYAAGSELSSRGDHELVPPAVNFYTITTGATASALSLTHFDRYLTRVVKKTP